MEKGAQADEYEFSHEKVKDDEEEGKLGQRQHTGDESRRNLEIKAAADKREVTKNNLCWRKPEKEEGTPR